MMPEGPVRCDACGVMAVQRGGVWVHVDQQSAAQSNVDPERVVDPWPGRHP